MAGLDIDVPSSFWDGELTTIFLVRTSEGHFEQVATDQVQAFLDGSGPLRFPPGSLQLAEVRLSVESEGQNVGIRSQAHFRRWPVDGEGRLDTAAVLEERRLPPEERRAKVGWWPSVEEDALLRAAVERLESENAGVPKDFPLEALGLLHW